MGVLYRIAIVSMLTVSVQGFVRAEPVRAGEIITHTKQERVAWFVFSAVTNSNKYLRENIDLDERVGNYISIKKFPLSRKPWIQTYLVEGKKFPYVGARRQMWWIVMCDQYDNYRVVGDLGPLDGVRVASTGEHGGLRDIFADIPPSRHKTGWSVRYIYRGGKYIPFGK